MSSERQEYNEISPWWGEHVFRYDEVIKRLKGFEKILDIACGNGYGTYVLSNAVHQTVIGGDIDTITISECEQRFKKKNLKYQVLDATKLAFEDNTFDVVVSFETIEHTTQFNKVLSEFKRVTKAEGVIFISTPNILVNSPGGEVLNPFHTQEWAYEELMEILSNAFSDVKLFGQEYARYKNKTGVKFKIGKLMENLLYSRGIRKLPIKLQDSIIRAFIGEGMYPLASNYRLTDDVLEVKACKTFFAICKP
jgi:ubiquinone/menaquinone biosynthesis C-methylase UbiE